MKLFVRLKGSQVTLRRRRRGRFLAGCPKIRRSGLLSSLPLVLIGVAISSVGFFIMTEVKIAQRIQVENQFLTKFHHRPVGQSATSIKIGGDFFKIGPLLDRNAPSVELSAQITLNRLYGMNNRKDILNYYNWNRCRGSSVGECGNFSLEDKSTGRKNWWSLKSCPLYPSNLVGPRTIDESQLLSINQMDPKVLANIKPGGWWEPSDCLSRHSVAVVIPYKDRWRHLTTLLNYLHPLLQRQQLRYKLFVVEQYGNETFNKGIVMNAGFVEAMKEELFHCFIFHDVDLIPENDQNMYTCPEMPRHLSVAVNELHYRLPYVELVGGAFAIRTDHFLRVNGYSNFFWGWGGEDDDMGMRVSQAGLNVIRPLPTVGRYTMIKHVKRKPADVQVRRRLLATARRRYRYAPELCYEKFGKFDRATGGLTHQLNNEQKK